MHINLETPDKHSIQAYNDQEIKINSKIYQGNLVVNSQGILTDWPIDTIENLDEALLTTLLHYQPEIIIIGHQQLEQFAPFSIRQDLAKQRIGLECMSISAACRTFNILLSELRAVTLGIILPKNPMD